MSSIQDFINLREQIEALSKEMPRLVEQKAVPQARAKLDEAAGLLAQLTSMVDNDVQVIAVGRLTRLLDTFQTKVGALEAKRRVVKKSRTVAP